MYTVYSLIHSPLILDLALIQCIYTLSFIYSPKPSAGPLTSLLSVPRRPSFTSSTPCTPTAPLIRPSTPFTPIFPTVQF